MSVINYRNKKNLVKNKFVRKKKDYKNINTIVLSYIHTRKYKFQCWQFYVILDKMLQF